MKWKPGFWICVAAMACEGLLAGAEPLALLSSDFRITRENYYRDRNGWVAINPKLHQEAEATVAFPFPSGKYDVTIRAVGENDGESTYWFSINDSEAGSFQCPLSQLRYEEGEDFSKTWRGMGINSGDVLEVRSRVGSTGGGDSSRARWSRLEFVPADETTRTAVAELHENRMRAPDTPADPGEPMVRPRKPDGTGAVAVNGVLRRWHKVTLSLDGPYAHERDNDPNPFTDYRFDVTFTHESGAPAHVAPGYFAADGDAADSSAESGTVWRAHLAPDRPGTWRYEISFRKGTHAAVSDSPGEALAPYHGLAGSFEVADTDKAAPDFRAGGRLDYVGRRYLRFAGSGEYFLKAGADAPETLLACEDFDGTVANRTKGPLKTWAPHVADWRPGDPAWKDGKGKGLIGALNYLSGKGVNAFSFLTYNAGGDGDNVWPFIAREAKLHYDCSKLDQWGVVFDHATAKGLYLHFKMQENEMDDDRRGHGDGGETRIPESLDGGRLGVERKLYCRELIARFGHNLALNWNIGEENTQSTEEVRDMVRYLRETDPWQHPVVIHTFPSRQDNVYPPLLGKEGSLLTGASLQNAWNAVHQRTLKWIRESEEAGRPWVVANDEQNPASYGAPNDPGYRGHSGEAELNGQTYTLHDIRKYCLWGNLMAGGAGVEYYFGYKLPENDLLCEDFRSRDQSWDFCRIALDFFREREIPFWEMESANALAGNAGDDNSRWCFAKAGEIYLVYLPEGGACDLDLQGAKGAFTVRWFDPRNGGELKVGSTGEISGGGKRSLGDPPDAPEEDWLVVVERK